MFEKTITFPKYPLSKIGLFGCTIIGGAVEKSTELKESDWARFVLFNKRGFTFKTAQNSLSSGLQFESKSYSTDSISVEKPEPLSGKEIG